MENKGTRWKLLKQHKNMELTQNGRCIGMSKKYHIAINESKTEPTYERALQYWSKTCGQAWQLCWGTPIPGWGRQEAAATPTG